MGRWWWRENLAGRFMRPSAGTFGLVASSSKGSPGASARIVKSTRLIPNRTGIEIRSLRTRYLDMPAVARGGDGAPGRRELRRVREPCPHLCALRLFGPVGESPEVGDPPALSDVPHLVGDRRHPRPEHHRDDHDILDHEVVHLDEERGPLDGVELRLLRLVELG